MSLRWLIRIEVWPHSTGRGQEIDQIQAGGREHIFEVVASSVHDALVAANLIAKGIHCNPIVWETPITEVRQLGHDERIAETYLARHDDAFHAAAKLRMPAHPDRACCAGVA